MRRVLGNLALAFLGIAAGLALLEATARLFVPQESAYTGRGLFRADPELGHALQPGAVSGDVHVNAFGLRGRETTLEKPAGRRRVLVLGDSHTFGRSSPDEVYPERLEMRLRKHGLDAEVLNAGVPGYDTRQEIGWLRVYGLRFAPDVVVLGVFVTGDVIENASGTLYEVVDGELTTTPVGRAERWLRRSHLYRFLRRRLTVHAAEPAPPGIDRERYLEVEWARLQVCRRDPDRLSRRGFRATEGLLRELRDLLRERRIDLLVLLIPDEVQVDPDVFAEVLKARGGSATDHDLDLPSRTLREFLDREGIAVVDLLPELRDRQRVEPVYRPRDTHWNAAGHAVAARRLADRVATLLEARPPSP